MLVDVSLFPPSIALAGLPRNTLGAFRTDPYSIQISSSVTREDPKSIASILAHELTHARQLIAHATDGRAIECYGFEEEAFANQLQFWTGLYGESGKPGARSRVDRALNALIEEQRRGRISDEIRQLYADECENWELLKPTG
jgi:hypothetical protein